MFSCACISWDIPALRNSLDTLLRDEISFPDFEVERDFPGLRPKNLVLGGCHLNHLKMILLAVDDITERNGSAPIARWRADRSDYISGKNHIHSLWPLSWFDGTASDTIEPCLF